MLHDRPELVPGNLFVLFASQTNQPGAQRIEAAPLDGGPRKVVVERATTPAWSPTSHLLFERDGAVMAVAFDPNTATLGGSAVPVMPAGAVQTILTGGLGLRLSPAGTLVFVPRGFTARHLLSVGRDGAALALDLPPGGYGNPRISPDGRRLIVENDFNVIEAIDLLRGSSATLTTPGFGTAFATWNADGTRVVARRFNMPFWVAADGTGRTGPLPNGTSNDYPSSAGPDPDSVIVHRIRLETSSDLLLVSISGAFTAKPLVATPAYEGGAQMSPDGRWMVYQSNSSGQPEIYLRRYPALDRQWQVSGAGGVQARWNPNGREIFFRDGRNMIAVPVNTAGTEPVFGKATTLFADDYGFGIGSGSPNYDVTRDGRFIMIRRSADGGRLRVVLNFTGELKRIVAAGGVR